MKKILKEPLLHFLVIGVALFALFEIVTGGDEIYDSKVIGVDRGELLTFAQFRSSTFEPGAAAAKLDAMTKSELEQLVDDYVREEALHREALALGMDKNDYVIKRRLIQSLEFITNGFVAAVIEVSDDDVQTYYEVNIEDYFIDPVVTFTHVFFDSERHGRDGAMSLARIKIHELNAGAVPFSESIAHGDRFHFFANYVEREQDLISSHFGLSMAEHVFALEPGDATWHGPFQSKYGAHLVMLTHREDGHYPDLAEIDTIVRNDAERAAIDAQNGRAIQAIVDSYEVRWNFE